MDQITLGRRIASRRTLLGLTQAELAEKLQATQATVSDWENDKVVPSFPAVKRVAVALGLSIDYLAGFAPLDSVDRMGG